MPDTGDPILPAERSSSCAAQGEVPAGGPPSAKSSLQERFQALAERWKRDTRFCSSRTKMVNHPAYQEIISLGKEAIPLILAELRTEPHYWFAALQALTGEDPVAPQDKGVMTRMATAWLEWARTRGL